MILGGLASVLAAAWKFLRAGEADTREQALDALYVLGRKIRTSNKESELAEIEEAIDKILQVQRSKASIGDENSLDVATLNVAAHRLENLIHDRRAMIAAHQDSRAGS